MTVYVDWVLIVLGIIAIFSIAKLILGEMAIDDVRSIGDPFPPRPEAPRYPLPKKKVATCQFCGRGIEPGAKRTDCPGCGAPIVPVSAMPPPSSPSYVPGYEPRRMEIPPPGPSNPIFRTGLESNLWNGPTQEAWEVINEQRWHVSTRVDVEFDELRGDGKVLSRVIVSPDTFDYRLLGKEKR